MGNEDDKSLGNKLRSSGRASSVYRDQWVNLITRRSNVTKGTGSERLLMYAIKSYNYNSETLPSHGIMKVYSHLAPTQLVRFAVTSKEGTGDPNEPSYLEA